MSELILEKLHNVKNIDAIVENTTNEICELNSGIQREFAELTVWNLVHALEKEILNAKNNPVAKYNFIERIFDTEKVTAATKKALSKLEALKLSVEDKNKDINENVEIAFIMKEFNEELENCLKTE